jgi:hypothetical protein
MKTHLKLGRIALAAAALLGALAAASSLARANERPARGENIWIDWKLGTQGWSLNHDGEKPQASEFRVVGDQLLLGVLPKFRVAARYEAHDVIPLLRHSRAILFDVVAPPEAAKGYLEIGLAVTADGLPFTAWPVRRVVADGLPQTIEFSLDEIKLPPNPTWCVLFITTNVAEDELEPGAVRIGAIRVLPQ